MNVETILFAVSVGYLMAAVVYAAHRHHEYGTAARNSGPAMPDQPIDEATDPAHPESHADSRTVDRYSARTDML